MDAEAAGVLASEPVVAIDLDAQASDDARAVATVGELARQLPAVVIGTSRLPDPPADPSDFDLLLSAARHPKAPWVGVDDVDTELDKLATAIDASPAAAVILVQLLRLNPELSIIDGLVAESLGYSLLQAGPAHQSWLTGQRRARRKETKPESEPPVLVDRDQETLFVRLNRPHVHNAYNAAMRDGLAAAFELAAADSSVARVELLGNGPSFSSGGDLNEFGTSDDPVRAHLIRTTRSPAAALARIPDRTVAFVHGSCVGAGVELPAFAGRVIADRDTTFRLPEVAMGLIPGAGGTVSLSRRIGRQRTAYFAITGQAIDVATAVEWHLVDELTPPA